MDHSSDSARPESTPYAPAGAYAPDSHGHAAAVSDRGPGLLPPGGEPGDQIPLKNPWYARAWRWFWRWFAGYFTDFNPSILVAFTPLLALALVLYTRDPRTNYIFDEQEALLANPYVNASDGLGFWDAIHRDFWGLPPDASIGSYRPVPNFLWRLIWQSSEHRIARHPFVHHLYNVVGHALSGAVLTSFTFSVTRRRRAAWFAGAIFVASAVITEAVSGIVGIADVLGGLAAVLALLALRLPAYGMPLAVFATVLVGLFSKESAMVCVPLIPLAALATAGQLHPKRPARAARAILAFAAALAAFVLYVELRREWFPSPLPAALKEPLAADASQLSKWYRDLMVWFRQAPLPADPLNNPLADGDFAHRTAGALRIFWRGLTQIVFPWTLSGDYSKPQEPLPTTLYGWESIAGGVVMLGSPVVALGLAITSWVRERRARRALADDRSMSIGGLFAMVARATRHRLLAVAVVLTAAGTAGVVTELFLLLEGGPAFVTTWPYSAALIIIGLGILTEAWGSPRTPIAAVRGWPLRIVAPLLVALGLVWIVISYFPHSNIPIVLPTVRAERFWYFPVIGSALALAMLFEWGFERFGHIRLKGPITAPVLAFSLFFGFQCTRAYMHAMDYENDLTFWYATKEAVPNSAKAHLNYSVMKGARGDLETRLVESKIALELAPEWPMAHIYTGDTLCRMHRPDEAWPYYEAGFDIGPDERGLISLALQCMWDEKILAKHDAELRALSDKHVGSWLAYLAIDTLNSGEKYNGVDPKYRPRGYNEGPKDDE